MSGNYHIHEMRHYLVHLLGCSPGLLDDVEPPVHLRSPEELRAWAQRLPQNQLVETCAQCVRLSFQSLGRNQQETLQVLQSVVFLPSEWDLDDVCALMHEHPGGLSGEERRGIDGHLEELIRRGLIVPGKGSQRRLVPFPVRFSLQGKEPLFPFDWELTRRRLVMYFAERARIESGFDPSLRFSWRLANMLFAFYAAVEWLEDDCGGNVRELARETAVVPIARDLAQALADFGRALGFLVSSRRSEQAWRSLWGSVVGAHALQRWDLEGDLYRLLGHYYRQLERWADAAECLENSRLLFLRVADAKKACLMGSALALTLREQGLYDEALEEFERAWTFAGEHNLNAEKISIANCAGEICLQADQPGRARQWFLRGWHVECPEAQRAERAELCNNVGRALRDEGQLDEALQWFFEALRLSREPGIRTAEATAYAEIARVWELRGNPADAIVWLERAYALRKELADEPAQAALLCDLARCARLDHRMADALEYAGRGKVLARRHSLNRIAGEIYLELAEQAIARGDESVATEAFLNAQDRLAAIAPAPQLARIHFRLALILYKRTAILEAATNFLVAQALARHAHLTPMIKELDGWMPTLESDLGAESFFNLVEHITDKWEHGDLGARFQSPQRPKSNP